MTGIIWMMIISLIIIMLECDIITVQMYISQTDTIEQHDIEMLLCNTKIALRAFSPRIVS